VVVLRQQRLARNALVPIVARTKELVEDVTSYGTTVVIVVGGEPFSAGQLADAISHPITAVWPDDPRSVHILQGEWGIGSGRHSGLLHAARPAAEAIIGAVAATHTVAVDDGHHADSSGAATSGGVA
jgi:hypothetical protein